MTCMLLLSIGMCWRLLASVLHRLGKSALIGVDELGLNTLRDLMFRKIGDTEGD